MTFAMLATITMISLVTVIILLMYQKDRLERQNRTLSTEVWSIWRTTETAWQYLAKAQMSGRHDLVQQEVLSYLFHNLGTTFRCFGKGAPPSTEQALQSIEGSLGDLIHVGNGPPN